MKRHPAGKCRINPTEVPAQPKCTCKTCETATVNLEVLFLEMDAIVQRHKEATHAEVERNLLEEQNRTTSGRMARVEHLRLMGDSDA